MNIIQLIIYFFLEMLITAIMLFCTGKMFDKKIKVNKQNILTFILITILLLINNLYNVVSLKAIIAMILFYISNKLIYKSSVKTTLLYVIIYTFISLVLEIILSPICLIKIKNIYVLNNKTILKIFFSIINGICLVFIFSNKHILNIVNKIISSLSKFFNFFNVSIIILFILNILIDTRALELKNFSIVIVSCVCTVFMIISIKIILIDKYNINILQERNKNIKDSYKAYEETIEECRILKHNLKNELYAMKSSLPHEYQDLLNKIIIKYNKNYEWINNIGDIPGGLQGLIYLKINEANQKKINIYINTDKSIKTNEKDYLDLCNIVGILLDNAIEASKLTKKRIIEINIKEDIDEINIKIINLFNNSIDTSKIGEKNYSTKEFKSGLGLNYIKKVKNSNINVNFKIINDVFITNVLYKQIKK